MQDNHFRTPPTHPGLYPSDNANQASLLEQRQSPCKRALLLAAPVRTFAPLNPIPQHDDFDATLAEFKRSDKHVSTIAKPIINVIIRQDKLKSDLANYHHGSMFSPVRSTFLKAIENNHFSTFPGLTTALIRRNLSDSVDTAKGHQNQERQGIQSTKPSKYTDTLKIIRAKFRLLKQTLPANKSFKDVLEQDILCDYFPSSPSPNEKTNEVIHAIVDLEDLVAYGDLTGKFPYKSSRGNQYILVTYHYDGNNIRGVALKNREAATITNAYSLMNDYFAQAGVEPKTWVLDNEFSGDLRQAFGKSKINYQLVPPKTHRSNAAERAVQTYKNHFKSGLSSLDPDFPIKEWDRLIPQANLTLNLLRAARANPNLSAHAYIEGQYDYNKTPLAPPGTRVVAHEAADQRPTWGPNGEDGWTIGPSTEHYRCIRCYFPKTRSERNVKTVTFFPHKINFPTVTTDDFLRQATTDIVKLLTTPLSGIGPTLAAGDDTSNAILKIARLLNRSDKIPKSLPPVPPNPVSAPRVLPIVTQNVSLPRVPKDVLRNDLHNLLQQKRSLVKRKTRTPTLRDATWKRGDDVNLQTRYNLRSRQLAQFLNQPNATISVPHFKNFKTTASRYLVAQEALKASIAHIYNSAGTKQNIGTLLIDNPTRWARSLSNEWGRLSLGNDIGVEYTDTLEFIDHDTVPINKK